MAVELPTLRSSQAVARWKKETKRAPSPLLGALTDQEAEQLQLRHAELHMSFLLPA